MIFISKRKYYKHSTQNLKGTYFRESITLRNAHLLKTLVFGFCGLFKSFVIVVEVSGNTQKNTFKYICDILKIINWTIRQTL